MGSNQNGEIESQLLLKLIMERRNKLGKVISNYKELPNASKKSLIIIKRNQLYQTKLSKIIETMRSLRESSRIRKLNKASSLKQYKRFNF